MRWRGREGSENVEDRRGSRQAGLAVGGGGCGLILLIGLAIFFGADPRALMRDLPQPQVVPQQGGGAVDDEAKEFISVVLRDTEEVWTRLFQEYVQGGAYTKPTLVIFSGQVNSACGPANAAVGPFYCPADEKVYIDPTFFDQLARRHNAPGDFAQAYVLAHEVSHHVQKLLGFSDQVEQVRRLGNSVETNRASVRLELQADFLAGVWAHHAHQEYNILEPGDIEEAMTAANQIGDDTLQRQAQGFVVPQRYTHGTSAQRVKWFKQGLASGRLADCQQLFDLDYSQL